MTPFLHFRVWLRRAPAGERAGVALVVVVLAALVAWIAVPTAGPNSSLAAGTQPATAGGVSTRPGVAPSAAATGAGGAGTASPATAGAADGSAGGGGVVGQAGSTATGTGGTAGGGPPGAPAGSPGATATAGSCGATGSTDQGVSASSVTVAVLVGDLEGSIGNSLIGLPSASDEEKYFQAVIDYVNKHGGADCRRIVPQFYTVNLLDTSQQHSQCLAIVQAHVFAAIDTALTYSSTDKDCLAQNKIPFLTIGLLTGAEIKQYYPYVYSWWGRWDWLLSDYALGAKQLGFFAPSHGFKKVGVLEESCFPELNRNFAADLSKAGIASGQIDIFNYGCPTGLVPPNEIDQAVLQFQTDGVTNVMDVDTNSQNDFSKQAQKQAYHPRYALADNGNVATFESASFAPDPTNYDQSLAITNTQWGLENTPGLAPTPGTKTCDSLAAAAGDPSSMKSPVGYMGAACNGVFLLTQAMDHAGTLTRTSLLTGMSRVGNFDVAFPSGPMSFDNTSTVTGGQFWRPLRFYGSCGCFKVLDATWHPTAQ